MRGLATAVLGMLAGFGCDAIDKFAQEPMTESNAVRCPDRCDCCTVGNNRPTDFLTGVKSAPAEREIDRVLEANVPATERFNRVHGAFTTALNGIRQAAYDARALGETDTSHELQVLAVTLDGEWARKLTAIAARST